MNLPPLPETAFIDPAGGNRDAIAHWWQQVSELLLAWSTQAAHHSPLPPWTDTHLETWESLPTEGCSEAHLLAALAQILNGSMNAAHPGYVGHMDSIPTLASVIGETCAALLNNNLLSVEMSPVFSRLETVVLRAIAQQFGLGEQAGGLLTSGGTLANLHALTVARNVQWPEVQRHGLAAQPSAPVFFASEVAHTSLQKTAMVLGLGTQGVIPVRTNAQSQMVVSDLEAQIGHCLACGQTPFAIVATAGTTVTGNIDPLGAIAAIAQKHRLWFHVDAAYGGALQFAERYRDRLAGIEQADSVTFNPQKWLYVAKTCATVLFRHFPLLQQHYQIAAPYMTQADDWPNLGELSLQGTRHADILKLWLTLQHLGLRGYDAIIEHNYALTAHLVAHLRQRAHFRLASEPQMNVVCFRSEPQAVPADQWDAWNGAIQAQLLKTAQCFWSLPHYRGQRWLKAVLLNPYTQTTDIDRWFEVLDRWLATQDL